MRRETGHVLAAKMNSHRHQWNGTICSQPQSWNCGTDPNFRASYCDSGVARCFHLDVFKPTAPRFATPDPSVVLAVQQQPTLLNDQILVFYGGRFGAQQGISVGDYEQTLFGFYRVKHAILDMTRPPNRLIIEPYADGWAMFPRVHLRPAGLSAVSGVAYLKQLRAGHLRTLIDEALEAAESRPKGDNLGPDFQRRLEIASESLADWLEQAEHASAKVPPPADAPRLSVSFGASIEGPMAAKLKGLKILTTPGATAQRFPRPAPEDGSQRASLGSVIGNGGDGAPQGPSPMRSNTAADSISAREDAVTAPSEAIPRMSATPEEASVDAAPAAPRDSHHSHADSGRLTTREFADSDVDAIHGEAAPLTDEENLVGTSVHEPQALEAVPELHGRQALSEQFGTALVDALSVAFITKGLVILTGAPGAGKSWIASRLLDDASRERTVIVPVASTWRGREDLLGYVNPISGNFEPTEFTHFLCNAEQAWEAGDRRTRLVVFEEFNLSQPEHWLSDLLVRLEYDSDQLLDRTIRLGGKEINGRPGRSCSVVLVPNLRFVGTLNNDHTVKPLSPRVLDRAALIEVTSSGRAALLRAGVDLGDDIEDVIDDLNDLLEPRGAAFSVRSARSLQRAIEASERTGLDLTQALDLVLVQEVLSRVKLFAGDPRDEQLLVRLQTWTQKPGCAQMTRSAGRIADWIDLLSAGRDVFQA